MDSNLDRPKVDYYRVKRLAQACRLIIVLCCVVIAAYMYFGDRLSSILVASVGIVLLQSILYLSKTGKLELAARLMLLLSLVVFTFFALTEEGLIDESINLLPLIIIMTGLFGSPKSTLWVTLGLVLLVFVIGAAEELDYFTPKPVANTDLRTIISLLYMFLIAMMIRMLALDFVKLRQDLEHHTQLLESKVTDKKNSMESASKTLSNAQTELAVSQHKSELTKLISGITDKLKAPLDDALLSAQKLEESIHKFSSDVSQGGINNQTLLANLNNAISTSETVHKRLYYLEEIIQDLNSLSALYLNENLTDVDVKEVLMHVISSMSLQLESRNIQCSFDCDASFYLKSSEESLYFIFKQLISNSIHHAFSGKGCISIYVGRNKQGKFIRYEDNGVGMETDELARVFDAFWSTKIEQGRLGLGLHIFKNIVEHELQGNIHVKSAPDQGFMLEVIFPET